MKIEKLKHGSHYRRGMRYKADFDGIILYYTEDALAELKHKIEEIKNISSQDKMKERKDENYSND
jgi:hypothetical protein